ncbi:MAG: D-2-hydroxyacid dehydrogenase [Lysobacterales bacterium]
MTVSQGTFLDMGSLDNGDLDARSLDRTLPGWQWFEATQAAEVAERIADADVVVTNKCKLDRDALAQAKRLKLVVIAATGTNVVDLEAARNLGICVCNVRNYASGSVAQHVITLILNLVTGQPFYMQRVRDGEWCAATQFSLHDRTIREIRDLQLGIIGYGVLGRAVAKMARQMGMNVLVADRRGSATRPDRLRFEDVVAVADVVTIHCPLNDETRGLFDRRVIRTMKKSAMLINCARGGIVVEQDLADALRAGDIAGAGVDTLSEEPPPADHPLLAPDVPNLLITPHNAWASRAARQACLDQVADVITAFKHGQPVNAVA